MSLLIQTLKKTTNFDSEKWKNKKKTGYGTEKYIKVKKKYRVSLESNCFLNQRKPIVIYVKKRFIGVTTFIKA